MDTNEKDEIIQELIKLRTACGDIVESTRKRELVAANPSVESIVKNADYELIGMNVGLLKKIEELNNNYKELNRGIIKTVNRMTFYYNHIIQGSDGYDIQFHDDLTHNEDDMFHAAMKCVCDFHSFNAKHVDFHKRIDGIEFDCIVRGSTFRDKYARLIGIEFKDYDIETVVQQAVIRSEYTNVQYVVVNTSMFYIFDKTPDILVKLKEHKIGLICFVHGRKEETPVMILSSEIRRKTKHKILEDWFDENSV